MEPQEGPHPSGHPTDPLLVVDAPLVVFPHHHLDPPLPVIALQDHGLQRRREEGGLGLGLDPWIPCAPARSTSRSYPLAVGQPRTRTQLPRVSGARRLLALAGVSRSCTRGSSSAAHLGTRQGEAVLGDLPGHKGQPRKSHLGFV